MPAEQELASELQEVAADLRRVGDRDDASDVVDPLRRLMIGVDAAAAAWSGSPVGYHARVYYEGFSKVPPGARWSKEWGFHPAFSNEGTGDWREYTAEDVVHFIRERAGNPDSLRLNESQTKRERRSNVRRAKSTRSWRRSRAAKAMSLFTNSGHRQQALGH